MKTIDEQVSGDAKELRDMASYFDQRGIKSNGDFLRNVANKIEILWGAYQGNDGHESDMKHIFKD